MQSLKTISKILGAAFVLAFAAPSNADLVYVLNVDITGSDDGGTATVTFTNFVQSGDEVSFDVVVQNTTSVVGALTSLAWLLPSEVDDLELDSQAITAGTDTTINFELDYSPGNIMFSPLSDNFDACLLTGPNCTGGSVDDGIASGSTGTFGLTAFLDTTSSAENFEALLQAAINSGVSTNGNNPIEALGTCARFQGLGTGGESDKKCATGGDTPVPEPGTLALLGIGLMGLGIARRRRIKV